MDNNNLLSKKALRETYEDYSGYFEKIIQNVIKILQTKVKLMSQPTYKSRVKSFESYYRKVLRLKQISGLKEAFIGREFSKSWEEYEHKHFDPETGEYIEEDE